MTTVRVSPREYCLVVERLLQHAGHDRGVVIPLREIVLDAELATGDALRYVLERPDAVALLAAPGALDAARRTGRASVSCPDAPQLLQGLAISGLRQGVAVEVTGTDPVDIVVTGPAPTPASNAEQLAGGPQRLAAMTRGIDVDQELWWTAYRRSNLALSVDTRTSRRHAGATVVDEDGTVRGAVDDEFDPTVFTGERAALFDESKEN